MTYAEIETMINSTQLSNAYYQYPEGEAPALPYVLFYYPERDDFQADDKNYAKITLLNIELYTKNKDFVNEKVIEDLLDANEIPYDKEEQYIESENMYEVLYITEVIINES